MDTTPEISYFQQRMDALGITDEINSIGLWVFDAATNDNVLQPRPIFTQTKQGIQILVYTLQRGPIRIEKSGSKIKTDYTITRYENPIIKPNGDTIKYLMPKGHPTQPFFPPELIAAYDNKTPLPVLYITEGYFKAFKACMHGIPTVGVPSITCMKDKSTGQLYGDVLTLIKECKVQRLVWLTDGDCRDLTGKDIADGIDLSRRPANFYNTVAQFADLTSGLDETERYFAHINSEDIEGKPKGLDDLLCMLPGSIADIAKEAATFDKIKDRKYIGEYFVKMNISHNVGKVREYFHLKDVDDFYHFYAEQRPEIKGVEFKYYGTKFKYNADENKCEIVIPKAAGNYVRVGDHYYEQIAVPDKYNNIMQRWDRRDKTTITDDHTKAILKHIAKYNAFCTVPNHDNYQQIINNCFNAYHPFEHEAEAGDCSITIDFFKHIFGTNPIPTTRNNGTENIIPAYELGLDYFTLLYKHPQHILPILCLASNENNTGKSTFVTFLKYVFGQNAAIVSNEDLANSFNSHWSGKLLVMCEETKIDKDIVVEKVKALSTGSKIMMNAKGRDQVEIDFFGKFIFCTNNEDNFLPITDKDVRYWVIKVPSIPTDKLILDMEKALQDELPAFLHYINSRKMATDRQFRHWFKPDYLRTDALLKVIENTRPNIMKRLFGAMERLFYACDDSVMQIQMPAQDIAEMLGRKDDAEYIRRELKKLGYRTCKPSRGTYPVIEQIGGADGSIDFHIRPKHWHGTAYTFEREIICPGTGGGLFNQAADVPEPVETDLPF